MYSNFEKLLRLNNTNAGKVSAETGISPATLSEWKNGKYVPKLDKLQKIADYFGVTVDYLMGINKFIVEDIEIEYITLIKDARRRGYSVEDLKTAIAMLDMARGKK